VRLVRGEREARVMCLESIFSFRRFVRWEREILASVPGKGKKRNRQEGRDGRSIPL
jgi:hypothetical protein